MYSNLVGKAILVHSFSYYVNFFSLHVSGDCVSIVRRNNCVYVALETCYSGTCGKGKGKAVPLKAWTGPEGSGKLRFTDFIATAQDGGKVVSLTHRPPLPPVNTTW